MKREKLDHKDTEGKPRNTGEGKTGKGLKPKA